MKKVSFNPITKHHRPFLQRSMIFSLFFVMLFLGIDRNVVNAQNYSNYNIPIYANADNGDITIPSGYSLTITAANPRFGTITVSPDAQLSIQGTTVLMRRKIIVQAGDCNTMPNLTYNDPWAAYRPAPPPPSINRCLGGQLLVNNSTVTVDPSGGRTRWIGIELWGKENTIPISISEKGHGYFTRSTITKATIAVATSKDADLNAGINRGGAIRATDTRFIDNDQSIAYDGTPTSAAYATYVPGPPPLGGMYMMEITLNGLEYFLRCTFDYTTSYLPPNYLVAKSHVVLTDNCKDIRILGCAFDDHYNTTYRNCYGIVANQADFTVDNKYNVGALFGNKTQTAPSSFNNQWYAVLVYLQTNFNRVNVMNTTFTNNTSSIYASGTMKSIFKGNTITVPAFQSTSDPYYTTMHVLNTSVILNNGILLDGCNAFTVENNTINSQSNYSTCKTVGIYVNSSGPYANLINNNSVNNANYNYYAIGQNYGNVGLLGQVGLRFTCNVNTGSKNNDFTVMGGPGAGINGIQKSGTGASNPSAANSFATKAALFYNFYNQPGNNLINYYGTGNPGTGGPGMPAVKFNVNNHVGSTIFCAAKVIGPKFPLAVQWESRLKTFQTNIAAINAKPVPDSTDSVVVQDYYDGYSDLADSTLNHFLYDDSTTLHYDSLAYALEKMDLIPEYKIMLAGVYQNMLRYQDAVDMLSQVNAQFQLGAPDAERIDNLVTIYQIMKTLFDNNNNWGSLTEEERNTVNAIWQNDDYRAHTIAAALMQHFEGLTMQAPFIEPNADNIYSSRGALTNTPTEVSLYPVPTKNLLMVAWWPKNGETAAQFQITDVLGKMLISSNLVPGEQSVNTESLSPGIYFSIVKSIKGKVISQQKIVKQ